MVPWTQLLPPKSLRVTDRRGSAKRKVNTLSLCLILSLSICYNYPFRSWVAGFRPVWLSSHSSAGLSPQTDPSNYGLCYKAKHTDELGWKPLTITPATLSPLQRQQGEPIPSALAPDSSDSVLRGLDPQPVSSPKLRWDLVIKGTACSWTKQHLHAAAWHTDRAKEQQCSVFTFICGLYFNYKEITKFLLETHIPNWV